MFFEKLKFKKECILCLILKKLSNISLDSLRNIQSRASKYPKTTPIF